MEDLSLPFLELVSQTCTFPCVRGYLFQISRALAALRLDEALQEAVRLVLSLFEQCGSALAVVSTFAKQHLRFPTRWWGGKQADELIWDRLTHERVLNVLHSPLYAGAYVYGRTQSRRQALPGEEPRVKGRTRRVNQEDWPIVLLDAHPGYISSQRRWLLGESCSTSASRW